MCSNTSSSGGVISGSGGGDYASLLLKKPKRQRVPKRGPGVAELEKILREQETNTNGHVVDKDSSCRISSQFPNSYHHHHHHHPQSSSNLFTRNVQNISDHNHFISPPAPPHITMLYANGGKRTNGGGSSMVLPEQGLFPTATWRSSCCESSNNIYGESPKFPSGFTFSVNGSSDHMHHHHHQHFPVMLQKKPCQYSSPSTMVGMKRPRTFTVDNNLDPPFQFQVPPHFPHLNMPENSSSRDNQTIFNLKPNETVSRDHGGHFLIFGSGVASQQEFSKHNSLPFQETLERPNQVSLGQGGTVIQKKPFFSLFMPDEHIGEAETALTLNNVKGRTSGEAIDLNLKL
ncbi:hypothetical protein Ddye_023955 [Dipteronia dyeriana]|uniref:Uncharacterized protein n=1 Tax=Dipteronia dyeriana TaxID=168575 RepID=A0AAD9TUE8_9ROSI|nr:hypothetical protein Ddye_023955 [Dipteronia dyeriana]